MNLQYRQDGKELPTPKQFDLCTASYSYALRWGRTHLNAVQTKTKRSLVVDSSDGATPTFDRHAFRATNYRTAFAVVSCNPWRQQWRGEHLVYRSGDGATSTRSSATRCRGSHAGPLLGRSAGRDDRDHARRGGDAVGSGIFFLTRSQQAKNGASHEINPFAARVAEYVAVTVTVQEYYAIATRFKP